MGHDVPADAAPAGGRPRQRPPHGIRPAVVTLPAAKRGFVLLLRRWVVERPNAWMVRSLRLARTDEHLPETLARLHLLAFALLMLTRFVTLMADNAQ